MAPANRTTVSLTALAYYVIGEDVWNQEAAVTLYTNKRNYVMLFDLAGDSLWTTDGLWDGRESLGERRAVGRAGIADRNEAVQKRE